MYNPATSDADTMTLVQNALVAMKDSTEGQSILSDVLNTPAI